MPDPKDWRVEVIPHVSPPEIPDDPKSFGVDPGDIELPWDPMDEVKGA